ncbi:peptide/nickel transport system substrate-binding protein [Rhizobium petrolearium]|uniref:ABC transporter substrate-binding protein n=1 Tax=Neorhizobium petrolearium TaxID=515361 RepID=UPI001AE42F9E|nr:ABC transporter substrate-binding protein [Neorhizobium petrolearium]MBP1843367.1 peptide/nickel transport system substrate-binding protein [Neorhizobium petrolearium]
MINRRTLLVLLASTTLSGRIAAASSKSSPAVSDTPGGLPDKPRRVDLAAMGRMPGKQGGTIRMLIGGQRDIRLMPIYGYARLIGYDEALNLQPDILESFETTEDRIFTFRIRQGHCWSDGSEFTTEDFRFCWEDIYNNRELHRGGIPTDLRVDDQAPVFEILDKWTVRYSWHAPNPDFLAQLAAPSPLKLAMPAAYLKQFHARYQDPETLAKLCKKYRVETWSDLQLKMSRTNRPENPDLPTHDPWRNTTEPPASQFVFVRNPYFHRLDENGTQLPYIDRVLLNVSSADIIAAKAGAGESDLQLMNIDFADYTFLKSAEDRFPIKVNLWKRTQGSRIALLPNLNCNDEVWRLLLRDVRVRRALSLAIDRAEINKAVFYGLAHESANSILPESPLFKPEYARAWAAYDPEEANRLLDEAGLPRTYPHGIRSLPDGRPATIIVENAGENNFESDVLELIADHWREIGIKLFSHSSQRDLFRKRVIGGEAIMSVFQGLDNGVPTADMPPRELAPTADDQLQWPVWGLHYLSGGSDGHPPDMPEAIELVDLMRAWRRASTFAEREAIWHRMLQRFTDQVFTIGIVNAALQPVVRSSRLRNMPDKGLFGFDPTSYLGVYLPDTFWLEEEV